MCQSGPLHHVSLKDSLELAKKSGTRTPGCGRGLEPADILGETITRILACKTLGLQKGKILSRSTPEI